MSRSTVMSPMASRLWLGLVLAVGAFVLVWSPLQGADFGWHLQIGKVAWEKQTTLPREIFSYTQQGRPWTYKDLVADVVLYLLYSNLGQWGFLLIKLLAFWAVAWAYRRLFAPRGSVWVSLVVVILVWGAIQYRMLERPLIFSLVGFALLMTALERLRLDPKIEGWRAVGWALAPVVLIQWVWLQLHRGALLGYVIIAGWLIGLWVAYLARNRSWSLRWFGTSPSRTFVLGATLMLPASLLLGLLNLGGLATFTSSFDVANSDFIKQVSSEWQAVPLGQFFRFFPLAAALSLVGGLGWLWVLWSRRKDESEESHPVTVWPLLALLMFAVLTTRSIRWIPYLSMVGGVLVGHLLVLAEEQSATWKSLSQRLSLLVAAGIASWGLLYAQRLDPWTLGINQNQIPVGATKFVLKNKPEGNPMHAFRFGGYLMWKLWPTYKVQVDGRNDMVYPPRNFMTSLQSQRRPSVFFRMQKKHNISWVVAANHLDFQSHLFLARHPQWMMVYWSEAAVVYVKRKKYSTWKKLSFQAIHPASIDQSVFRWLRRWRKDPKKVAVLENELKRMVQESPRGIRSLLGMTLFHHLRGKAFRKQRNQWANRLKKAAGHRPEVQAFLKRLGV